MRFETAPGHQMQIDFGEKLVAVGERAVRVHLSVAVLRYSRRLFTRASLSQRHSPSPSLPPPSGAISPRATKNVEI